MTAIVLLALGCDPIYIPDPIDPRLPKYTQSGNNVAGALINDTIWQSRFYIDLFSSSDEPTVAHDLSRDTTVFTFRGHFDDSEFSTMLFFGMRGTGAYSLQAMTRMNDKKYEFGKGLNTAMIYRSDQECNQIASSGQLYCRSVKYNKESNYTTLSGTFSFTVLDPKCGDKVVTYGRFDFRISGVYPL